MAKSAAAKVAAIYELLERIMTLSDIKPTELLRAKLVSKQFKHVIDTSLDVWKKYQVPLMDPKFNHHIIAPKPFKYLLAGPLHEGQRKVRGGMHLDKRDFTEEDWSELIECNIWKNVFFCRPTTRQVMAVIAEGQYDQQFSEFQGFAKKDGLTLQDLMKIAKMLAEACGVIRGRVQFTAHIDEEGKDISEIKNKRKIEGCELWTGSYVAPA